MIGKESGHGLKSNTKQQAKSTVTRADAVKHICCNCGNKDMMSSFDYLRTARYYAGDKFVCEVFDNKGFYFGIRNKSTFRLIAIAVLESEQNKGIGANIVFNIIEMCEQYGLTAITFRTDKRGKALNFWLKLGAIIVREKNNEYEMIIRI